MDSEHYTQLVAWLSARPEAEHLAWSDESLSIRKPFVFPWVDVIIAQLQRELDLAWALTYRAPDHFSDQDVLDEHDPSNDIWLPYNATFSVRLEQAVPVEATLYPDDGAAIDLAALLPDLAASWGLYWSEVMAGDEIWTNCRVWTPEIISQAVSDWATDHAGRPDLRFIWDPEMVVPTPDLVVGADPGSGYQIGENLYASEAVFDELLQMDPQEAAALTQQFRELGEHFRQ